MMRKDIPCLSNEIIRTNNTVVSAWYLSRPYAKIVRDIVYKYMLHMKRLLSPLKVDERRTTIRIRAHKLNRNAEVVVVGSID